MGIAMVVAPVADSDHWKYFGSTSPPFRGALLDADITLKFGIPSLLITHDGRYTDPASGDLEDGGKMAINQSP